MELANVFLESDAGKRRLRFAVPAPCARTGTEMRDALAYFLSVLDRYVHVDKSSFPLAVRDGSLFYFRCERGKLAPLEHEFFVFDDVFLYADEQEPADVRGVAFVITESQPLSVRARRRFAVSVYANSRRYYGA
ncbi:virion core protein [Equine molluscum contagiosum-like virus]|nr:virion core protein [Equine molluscum contagiosum-like virus]